jgi:hypothetical protein
VVNSIYKINKGIGKPVEFRGFKGQYIWLLGIGLLLQIVGFSVIYLIGLNPYVCVVLTLGAGAIFIMRVRKLSNQYGEHGMMKKQAARKIPRLIRSNSRNPFLFGKGSLTNQTK